MRVEYQETMNVTKSDVAPKRESVPVVVVRPLSAPASGLLTSWNTASVISSCGRSIRSENSEVCTALSGLMSISSSSDRMRAYSNDTPTRKYGEMELIVAQLAIM